MAKFKDTIDLYDDAGKLLKSGVPLDKISPLVNPATRKIIDLTKRTIAVNLGGIQDALKTGKVGKGHVLGREMDLDIVGNKDAVIGKIKEMVQVQEGDDTKIREFSGGKLFLVEVPSARLEAASTYDAAITSVAAATTYAIVEQFDVGPFDAAMVKGAVWGAYPHTMDMKGALVTSILNIPQNNEGLGYALRNIPVNHVVMMTNKNAMEGAALASTFEQAGMFEMGNAIGPFERAQLLTYAYQGLNANNLVYDLVKKNGSTGTIGTVVQSLVERAIEDKVITPGKKGGYFQFYDTKDPMLWNAYAAAGTMAATMVNCGAGRFAQAVSSTLLYFNDLLEHETGLPGCDYGRVMGTAVGFSFFSHSIYGGGGPGIFNGNHVVTRHAAGVAIPCVVAAAALDAGTQMFSPESTSKIYADTYGKVDVFNKPIQQIAQGV
ncbi:coenzyme-B sulfoethylthiotransferase subunit beta [Methanoculleus bourgensis]|uniref:Methyl-coenzyme M reductase subunit beta n=4 Tax=Methanoculleus TaxID=45989 RepID=I7LK61_METBM|nr:coenzyme-B sulfoethylthiotransferase subunit beta [Methanoculleus bourgensis]MBT0732214.1 coenzyme-B sulfoethylthiotransferase subunit beta [Methanoculleus bourgensis]MDD3372208.1 coenzyme-B sulfoethylthiotransferase subunit beta [Methanoculleus bourgensis]NMA88574.1 coenzyme-B sulfoethylthiotransferase subunit beta [Methanoculleus bourgensis]CCJ36657.1 methyl-coenzyme M reductase beta subunit [Methanoculleus bourgensis MS2]CVK33444.1 Methyl-coenzyme M reductase subunit beta [Methanoculleus